MILLKIKQGKPCPTKIKEGGKDNDPEKKPEKNINLISLIGDYYHHKKGVTL